MTRDKLSEYCDLKEEISKLEKRIDTIQKQSDMVSDVVQNGYKRHAVIFGYDCKRAYKLEMLNAKLKERYDMALQQQIDIEDYINSIPKSDIRQIFEHRYINNMNWVQIMYAMNYKAESTARMKHDRFLEENL